MIKPQKLKVAVVKEEIVSITKDYRLALVLNQFLFWAERVYDFDDFIKEENEVRLINNQDEIDLRNGWIYKSSKQLIDELMMNCNEKTMRRYCKTLVKMGYLSERSNPKDKWDKKRQYRVNYNLIIRDLHNNGYQLQGYKYGLKDILVACQDVESKGQNVGSMEHFDGSRDENVGLKEIINKDYKVNTNSLLSKDNNRIESNDIDQSNSPPEKKAKPIKSYHKQKPLPDKIYRLKHKANNLINKQDCYDLINYWNGKQFTPKHLDNKTPYYLSLIALDKLRNKYSKDIIIEAIDNYDHLLRELRTDPEGYKIIYKQMGVRLSLDKWIDADNYLKSKAKTIIQFKDCININKLLQQFTVETKKDEQIYSALINQFPRKVKSQTEIQQLSLGSLKIREFYDANRTNINGRGIAGLIDKLFDTAKKSNKLTLSPSLFTQDWFYDIIAKEFYGADNKANDPFYSQSAFYDQYLRKEA